MCSSLIVPDISRHYCPRLLKSDVSLRTETRRYKRGCRKTRHSILRSHDNILLKIAEVAKEQKKKKNQYGLPLNLVTFS